MATTLSEFWKRGWLRRELDPEDAGKMIYRNIDISEFLTRLFKVDPKIGR